jgi:hypothetical protein
MGDNLLPILKFIELSIDHAHTWMIAEYRFMPDQ